MRRYALTIIVALTLGLAGCGTTSSSSNTPAATTDTTTSTTDSLADTYLDPTTGAQKLAADLQSGITAHLNDPKSDIYNDPNSSTYQPGETMGTITCTPIMPASNDQFTCMGNYNDTDHTQWSKTVQVTPDGTGYQTIAGGG